MNRIYRHGDVIIRAVKEMPSSAVSHTTKNLVKGEIARYAHKIQDPRSTIIYLFPTYQYLKLIDTTATIIHDEHNRIYEIKDLRNKIGE